VLTLRSGSEGGRFSGSETERLMMLTSFDLYNPFLIDVEYETLLKKPSVQNYVRDRLLVSWHDFDSTPSASELENKMHEMSRLSKTVKIVTTAHSEEDVDRVISLYGKKPENVSLLAFVMSGDAELSSRSRFTGAALGSPYTYVTMKDPIAPGQPKLDKMKEYIKLMKGK
jgi:3-dehydroquinate dehydratase-1